MVKITKEAALLYHSQGKPGKIEVVPTKPYSTQTDLSLAYSPGVAEPCLEIEKDPQTAYDYTAKGNLVAVISNGTAVLGLGDIGALSGKPVMEGKGLLFKIYAGIDVFDIEVNEKDPEKFIQAVKAIAPTFGGINLEDIKAPECFEIENRLKEELDIPVMHGIRIAEHRADTAVKRAVHFLTAARILCAQRAVLLDAPALVFFAPDGVRHLKVKQVIPAVSFAHFRLFHHDIAESDTADHRDRKSVV